MNKKINQHIYYYLLPLLLGGITSFSFPPYNFVLINFLTFPILLFILIEAQKKLNPSWLNFKIGWLFGIGYFLSNIYWIVYSLTFEDNFKPFIPFALILIPSFLGLFYGFITLIVSRFKLKKNLSSILIFSIIFAIVEFIRGFILGGFPWNLIVYSWTNYLNSLQILSTIGTYSFNLISITIFLFPLLIVFEKKIKFKIFLLIFIIFILICNNYYGLQKIKNDERFYDEFQDFKIKIISPKISIDRFFEYNNEGIIIEELIELSNPNTSQKTIFVFPEGALAGVNLNRLKNFKEIFSNKFSDKHTIVMGINTKRIVNNSLKTYNSMVILDNNLNLINEYNKIKLVPFGEFLPFENFFFKFGLKKITQGYRSFSSDNERKIININNLNFVPLICYEIIYSGKINKTEENFDLILNISEDGWFGNSVGPYQHFSHSIFRSIEEGKNLVRSANNGISAFINPKGQIINKIKSTERGVIEVKSFDQTKKTLFSSFGNKIFFYFLLFYISLFFFLKKKENR